ncbi:hypothetical protein [Anatilimnocola floriformis]|uniref:hypothetical protein n=1 Tax=Anatilimnocola floriformis TaxID=2948575 RepID=UPI0020C2CC39|nr:hypothetical protein [Anatilimnocola floriformis]
MNRVWGMLKWVRAKVSIKLALILVVMSTGVFTAWAAYSRFSKKAPLPEPKKVVTGVGDGEVAQLSAESPAFDPNAPPPPPTAQQPFAFNNNPTYGQPSSAPPAPLEPAYGDGGHTAPYQPPVAGPAPAFGPPPDATQPETNTAEAPVNPIRGFGVADNDPAEQPAAEQPAPFPQQPPADAYAQPEQTAPPQQLGPPQPLGPPTSLAPTHLQPAPAPSYAAPAPAPSYAAPAPLNRFASPPPAAAPVEQYQPSSPSPVGPSAGSLSSPPRSLGGYGQPANPSTSEMTAGREATGKGTPGERHFEGAQTPALTLEKIAPAEIQIGKLATFELRVKNVGQIAAQQVQVTDHIPKGTQLVESKPQFQRAADGTLVWPLGTMQAGDEQVIQLQVMPQQEGEIGSVAQVSFAASATARSVCTRPMLQIEHTAPAKLLIGESLNMTITVTNPGTGAATGIVVEEDVPQGLTHVAGNELEYEIGTLRPGESKRLELTLRADKAGVIKNTIVVRGDGNLAAQHAINIEVVAPQLQVGINGPKKRFLERPATYTLSISNPGTAAARDVELVAYLPRGMKFVETDAQGQYDAQQHAVFWSLEELPATKAGNVKLTAVPLEVGDQKLRIEGRADLGLNTAFEQVVSVDASAELVHSIADLSDPIEVGGDTTYEVRVRNVGTKTATNIRLAALLPAELKALSGEGPTRAANDGSRVIFEPLARLNPQEEAVFRIQANAQKAGDFIIRVQISSAEWPTPVTREESTRVYSDQ